MFVLNILIIHLGLHLMNLLLLKSGIYPLGGNGLPAVCSTIADDQTAEISQETENDNAKDNNQEGCPMIVGKDLEFSCCPTDA